MDAPGDNNDAELIFKLYYRFMGIEMTKAKFIIPMKHEGDAPEPDENGQAVIEKDFKFGIATMKGKNDRDAVIMYTDWRRLRSEYGKDWDGMVHTMGGLIGKFDCAVNPTRFPAAGSYITREMYEDMVKMAEQEKHD